MPDIYITFREDGDDPVQFRIPSQVTEKIMNLIAELNASPVLGIQPYQGKADWFARECFAKILKPVLDRYPDPPPAEAQQKLDQAEQLRLEAAQIIANAAVQPIQIVEP